MEITDYKHFCQTPHCTHETCGKCRLFSNTEEDDQKARREAAMKAQVAIGEAGKSLGLLSPEKKENANAKPPPLVPQPAGHHVLEQGVAAGMERADADNQRQINDAAGLAGQHFGNRFDGLARPNHEFRRRGPPAEAPQPNPAAADHFYARHQERLRVLRQRQAEAPRPNPTAPVVLPAAAPLDRFEAMLQAWRLD